MMNPNEDQNIFQSAQKQNVNIEKYLYQVLSNWYWVIIALTISIAIAFITNRYISPIYVTKASVMINDEEDVSNIFDKMYTPWTRQRSIVQNEQTVLKSYSLTSRTLEKMDMEILYYAIGMVRESQIYKNADIQVITGERNVKFGQFYVDILSEFEYRLHDENSELLDTVLSFGQTYEKGGHQFKILLKRKDQYSNKYRFVITNFNNLANSYRNKLQIELDNEYGTVLVLRIRGENRELIVDYLNTLSQEYIAYSLEKKKEISEKTLNYIQDQKESIIDSLTRIETQLLQIKISKQDFEISETGELRVQALEDLNKKKGQIGEKVDSYNQFLNLLKQMDLYDKLVVLFMMDDKSAILEDEIHSLQDLVEQREQFKLITKKSIPGIRWIDEKIENQENKIKENISTAINYNEWLSNKIDSALFIFRNNLVNLSIEKRNLLNVQRKYEVFRTFYNILLEKEAQISIQQSSISSDKRVLDPARVDNTILIGPKTRKNYNMGIVAGLLVSISLILLFNYLNPKIINKDDVIQNTNVPMLGLIGHNSSNYDIPVIETPHSAMAESFRRLRTNLQFIVNGNDQKVVMITSTISGEGKTFSSINLATVMALTDKKVVLLGMDLRKPNIHRIFDIPNEEGLSTYLAGKTKYDDLVTPVNIKNLSVMVSGPVPPNPAELIENKRMHELIEKLKNDFDYIFIDTPPMALVTDALLIAQHADATVFILRQNYTKKAALQMINEFYYAKKMKNLNLLVNDVNIARTMGYRYTYGYNYGYGYGYGKYYYKDATYMEDGEKVVRKRKIRKKRNNAKG